MAAESHNLYGAALLQHQPIPDPNGDLALAYAAQPLASPTTPGAANPRKRSSVVLGPDIISPTSQGEASDDGENEGERKRRAPGVKRACNECRQQKLRCDVVQDPYKSCSRCIKHKLECRIDTDFRRIGKRSRYAELERDKAQLEQENHELKRQLAFRNMSASVTPTIYNGGLHAGLQAGLGLSTGQPQDDAIMGSHEAVESLLHLKQGFDTSGGAGASPSSRQLKVLGTAVLAPDFVSLLFEQYFAFYHDHLPILDKTHTPDHIHDNCSHVLFWTVIVVASRHFEQDRDLLHKLRQPYQKLMWETVASVPQNHHVVKALCLLCTWPLPVSSTTSDQTFILSGVMMNIAKLIGLHRPTHPLDFSKTLVHLNQEDIQDRLNTWAACNIVAQNVSTGYGQPAGTLYDATLENKISGARQEEGSYIVPEELHIRLEIEKLCAKVSKDLYKEEDHDSIIFNDQHGSLVAKMLAQQSQELENRLIAQNTRMSTDKWHTQASGKRSLLPPLDVLHIRALDLHIRLYHFFDSHLSKTYRDDLFALYSATQSFLNTALHDCRPMLRYASNYIMQMMLAAGFTLLKLLNSFFGSYVVELDGRQLFTDAVAAIRSMSITDNDLPSRFTEVLVQMWNSWSQAGDGEQQDPASHQGQGQDPNSAIAGAATPTSAPGTLTSAGQTGEIDSSLQLKIRCRMSMSVVLDSVWQWREYKVQGKLARKENLETAVKNPSSPEAKTRSPEFKTRSPVFTTAGAAGVIVPPTSATPGPGLAGVSGEQNATASGLGPAGHQAAMMGSTMSGFGDIGLGGAGTAMAGLGGGGGGYAVESYELFDPWTLFLDEGALYSGNMNVMGGYGQAAPGDAVGGYQ